MGDVTMRFLSVPSFANATLIVRLALLIVAVQQGTTCVAEAHEEVPFKGTLQAIETVDVSQFPIGVVTGSGSGYATHLGAYTVTYEFVVNVVTLTGDGTMHFVAANGDSFFAEVTGATGSPTEDPDVIGGPIVWTIVDGTGRFAGATGEFIEDSLLNLVTGVRTSTLDGFIIK
jgi:hypothetical protein